MDYIFYSLYYFFSDGGKKDYFCKMSPEDNALFMISLDSAIIISSCIYVLINRAVMWCIIWSILIELGFGIVQVIIDTMLEAAYKTTTTYDIINSNGIVSTQTLVEQNITRWFLTTELFNDFY